MCPTPFIGILGPILTWPHSLLQSQPLPIPTTPCLQPQWPHRCQAHCHPRAFACALPSAECLLPGLCMTGSFLPSIRDYLSQIASQSLAILLTHFCICCHSTLGSLQHAQSIKTGTLSFLVLGIPLPSLCFVQCLEYIGTVSIR